MSIELPIAGRRTRLGSETNSTPVAGANDTVVGSGSRKYTFVTLPTSAALYIVTGIEWLNGTVVNGNVIAHVEHVDASPPTINQTVMMAWTKSIAQTGASAVQRHNALSSLLIPGGTILGVSIVSDSATARYGTTTVASANNSKTQAFSSSPAIGLNTAWVASTEEPYIKLYYKPVL